MASMAQWHRMTCNSHGFVGLVMDASCSCKLKADWVIARDSISCLHLYVHILSVRRSTKVACVWVGSVRSRGSPDA
jgi:hypothetical protein